jgi:DNA-binding transcriptional regulator PaaX
MIVMATTRSIDPKPLLHLLEEHGGECTFDDGIHVLTREGLSENDARDALWRLLSQGIVEFTTDRLLRLPHHSVRERAAG